MADSLVTKPFPVSGASSDVNIPDWQGDPSGVSGYDQGTTIFLNAYYGGTGWQNITAPEPQVPRVKLNKSSRSNAAQQATIAGAGSVMPLIYGRRRVGGRIAGVQVWNGRLYILAVWCYATALGIDAIESVDVANQPIQASKRTDYLGTQTEADPILVDAKHHEGRTYFDILPGICYSVIGIGPKETNGFPTVNAIVRGLKVASSDGGAKAYSTVPAYIVADFITNTDYGMGARVNWDDVALLAARNNSIVSGEARNTLNVSIDNPQPKSTWLAVLCDYAGAFPYKDGDTWRLMVDGPV